MSTQIIEAPVIKDHKTSHKITLSALRPRTQGSVRVSPLENAAGRLFTGQGEKGFLELLTKDEREALSFVIDRNTVIRVGDGHVIDLDDPIDAANWKWMQRHPYISMNEDLAKSNPDAVFYVNDPEASAEKYVKTSKLRDTARAKVYDLSYEQLKDFCAPLGLTEPGQYRLARLQEWLLQQCDIAPSAVLTVMDPEHSVRNQAMAFLDEALRYKIIDLYQDGAYRFGGPTAEPIGTSRDEVVEYLIDEKNMTAVLSLRARLSEMKKV